MADYDYLAASDGTGDPPQMVITADRLTGDATLHVSSVTKVPTKFIATSGTPGSDGFLVQASLRNFKGHLSGSDLVIDSFEPGSTDDGNTSGQVVVIKPNSGWANRVAKFMQNFTGLGTPEDATVGALTVSGSVTLPAGSLETADLAYASVTDDKWRNGVSFSAHKSSSQALGAATFTKITCTVEDWDLGSDYDTTTSTFTAPCNGIYMFTGAVGAAGDTNRLFASIYVNGSEMIRGTNGNWSSTANEGQVVGQLKLNESDTVEMYGWRGTAGNIVASSVTAITNFQGYLVTRI